MYEQKAHHRVQNLKNEPQKQRVITSQREHVWIMHCVSVSCCNLPHCYHQFPLLPRYAGFQGCSANNHIFLKTSYFEEPMWKSPSPLPDLTLTSNQICVPLKSSSFICSECSEHSQQMKDELSFKRLLCTFACKLWELFLLAMQEDRVHKQPGNAVKLNFADRRTAAQWK